MCNWLHKKDITDSCDLLNYKKFPENAKIIKISKIEKFQKNMKFDKLPKIYNFKKRKQMFLRSMINKMR